MEKQSLRIFFSHNSLPEYRVEWFRQLSLDSDCLFVVTNPCLAKQIYGFSEEQPPFSSVFLDKGMRGYITLYNLLKDIGRYDFLELPPIDSFGEFIKSCMMFLAARHHGVKCGYFWEKWEAPLREQPLQRRIKNFILKTVGGLLFKRVDVVFSSGSQNRAYFVDAGVAPEKIKFLPDTTFLPDCPYQDIRAVYGIPQDKILFMYFGRIMPEKGLHVLIRAIAQLPPSYKERIRLLVVGDGAFRAQCEGLVRQLAITKEVLFAGAIKPALRGNYFQQCDAFVHPGIYYLGRVDVWGLTLNEAIQTGKWIIATKAIGSAHDLIRNGVNGNLIEPENVNQLVESMYYYADHQDACNRSARSVDKELSQVYSCQNMAKMYVDAVKEIVGKK